VLLLLADEPAAFVAGVLLVLAARDRDRMLAAAAEAERTQAALVVTLAP
jgi:hypothetical protein